MQHKFIGSIDQGTTSTRFILFDQGGKPVFSKQIEHKQIFPQPGWVEHDPLEIWNSQINTAKDLIKNLKVDATDIGAIGIANQRETIVLWDKTTGEPVYNAIVWQDKRTADLCQKVKKEGWSEYIKENTGLIIDSYFSATKIHWILNNVPEVKERAIRGEITIAVPLESIAGSWKQSDLPAPVGSIEIVSFDSKMLSIICF